MAIKLGQSGIRLGQSAAAQNLVHKKPKQLLVERILANVSVNTNSASFYDQEGNVIHASNLINSPYREYRISQIEINVPLEAIEAASRAQTAQQASLSQTEALEPQDFVYDDDARRAYEDAQRAYEESKLARTTRQDLSFEPPAAGIEGSFEAQYIDEQIHFGKPPVAEISLDSHSDLDILPPSLQDLLPAPPIAFFDATPGATADDDDAPWLRLAEIPEYVNNNAPAQKTLKSVTEASASKSQEIAALQAPITPKPKAAVPIPRRKTIIQEVDAIESWLSKVRAK